MQSGGIATRLGQATFLGVRKAFLKGAGRNISPHMRGLLGRLRKDGIERGRRVHEEIPQCLIHGDLRLDNIFFDGDDVRALIDWQLSRTGAAVIDVAYFIGGSLGAETPEAEVETLLRRYHDALVKIQRGCLPAKGHLSAPTDVFITCPKGSLRRVFPQHSTRSPYMVKIRMNVQISTGK